MSVPQIFVVETELMPVSETLDTPVEKFGSDDVRPDFERNEWFLATARRSHGKGHNPVANYGCAVVGKSGESMPMIQPFLIEMALAKGNCGWQ